MSSPVSFGPQSSIRNKLHYVCPKIRINKTTKKQGTGKELTHSVHKSPSQETKQQSGALFLSTWYIFLHKM